jgi:hypothetical protein
MPPRRGARPSAFVAAFLLALTLAPALAGAQVGQGSSGTFTNPVVGAYSDIYVIAGRVIDALGNPAWGANLTVEIQQKGVTAKPLHATADCFGLFITFFDLVHVDPKGSATVTVHPEDGGPEARNSSTFDPFFRRSDIFLQYQGKWPDPVGNCADKSPLWPGRVSLMGRVILRSEPYEHNGETFDARPYTGRASLRFVDEYGQENCPLNGRTGECETEPVDERGDFKYSWVFQDPVNATGEMQVRLENKTWNFTIDPVYRTSLAYIEISGQGRPPPKPTPGVDAVAVIVPALALALASRKRRA